MAGHTPGPWFQDERDVRRYPSADSRASVLVAKVAGSNDESAANARLIASAPELLEALTDLHIGMHAAEFPNLADDAPINVGHISLGKLRRVASAIAKARG